MLVFYGIDLGTNPTRETLKPIQIRERLNRGKIAIYLNEQIALKKLRELLKSREKKL